MKKFRCFFSFIALALTCSFLVSGCATLTATKQPGKRDLKVLKQGTRRAKVIAELGRPVLSEYRNGQLVEVFSFKQGYSKPNRVSRSFLHGTANVATLGLWEVIGTPTEGIFSGKNVQVEVYYDEFDRVVFVEPLNKGIRKKKIPHRPPSEFLDPWPRAVPQPAPAPFEGL